MSTLLQVLSCVLLLLVAYFDFKERAIPVYLLIGLAAINIAFGISKVGTSAALMYLFINTAIILLLILLLTIYYTIKERAKKNIFDHKLGVGDIIFWICITPLFSTVNFVFFFILSLLSILIVVIFQLLSKKEVGLIPLAGYQALVLFLLITINGLFFNYNFYIDLLLLE